MDPKNIHYPDVILLGTQRSGTTLLTRILSAHSQLFIQNEISVEQIFADHSPEAIVKRCADQIESRHGISLSQLLADQGKSMWGFKDPQLTEHLDALEPFLNKSKFITIVRDGRGVVNSYIDNKWGLGTTAFTGALRWKREVEQQEAFMKLAPDQCLYIRYEDLVADLETTLKKVCDHLGIPFEEKLLEFHKQKAQFKLNASNINTNQKATTSFSTRWQRELSARQVEEIESVASSLLEKNGYKLTSSCKPPSKLRRLYYRIHQAIVGEIQIQYQLKRVSLKRFMSKEA